MAIAPWLTGVALLASASPSSRPLALDPAVRLSQYAHTAWRVRDGLLGSSPYAVAQTRDGYLWIGTQGGLVRFDGARFVPWLPPAGPALPSTAIFSLLGARDGSLWIGTGFGPAHWTNGRLVVFPEVQGRINAMLEDDDGTVWIARNRYLIGQHAQGPVCRLQGDAFRCLGASEGLAWPYAGALAKDSSGALWIGSSSGLSRWKDGRATAYMGRELERQGGGAGIGALAAGLQDRLWVGVQVAGPDLGLRQLADGASTALTLPGLDGTRLSVSALLRDGRDALWVGTSDEGLYRVSGGRADRLTSADGLSSDTIIQLFQDREGSLWVVTSKGLDRFRDYRIETLSAREGLKSDNAGSVLARADGSVWIGNLGSLEVWRDGALSSITRREGLPGENVASLFEDRRRRLWVGIDDQLYLYEAQKFRAVKPRLGASFGMVVDLDEDPSTGDLFAIVVGNRTGLVRVRELQEQEFLAPPAVPRAHVSAPHPEGGIWLGLADGNVALYRDGRLTLPSSPAPGRTARVWDVLADNDGSVWSVSPRGLTRWSGGTARTLDDRQGLPCNAVYSLIRDTRRALWLFTGCGLVRIGAQELEGWAAGGASVAVTTFDALDGLQPGGASFQPSATRTSDGRLWFATDHFVQTIDPNRLAGTAAQAAVYVEQVVADRRTYGARDGLVLPPLTREIQLDYSAPSFVIPERVKFRYRLEPRDDAWQEPGTRRQAFYNDLPPGDYRFRVLASNHDGVWNESGAALSFSVEPAYYQTAWFRACLLALAAGVLWMVYAMRLRQMTSAAEARLQTRLAERERIAREIHDTLLQGLNGLILKFQAVADRLAPSEPARAMIEQALDRADQAVTEGRSLVEGLRAQDQDGLEIANSLREVGAELAKDGDTALKVIVEGRPRALHVVAAEELYWVGREALVNAFHAARAAQVELELGYSSRELRLSVRDDGTGIDAAVLESGGRPGHWGMRGMKERAARVGARLEISSRAGAGTEITLRVPGSVAYRREGTRSLWSRLRGKGGEP